MNPIMLNIFLAFILFILNYILGRIQYGYGAPLFKYGKFSFDIDEESSFSGNFFLKIINPTIFMAISCAVMQSFVSVDVCRSLWLLVPMYWGLRVIYILVKNILCFINIGYEAFAAIASLLMAESVFFILILPLIAANKSVFIPIDELRNAVWFAIIAYVVKTFWDICNVSLSAKAIYPAEKRHQAIFKRYDMLSKKYGEHIQSIVDDEYPETLIGKGNFVCLLYAVMIFEDYNRPKIYRMIEFTVKKLCPSKEMTLGIMQVATKNKITDKESIKLAVSKLIAVYLQSFHNSPILHALADYNQGEDYQNEVVSIYNALLERLSIDELIEDNEAYLI